MESGFHNGDADASRTRPTQCSSLRRGGYVILKGHACKIVEISMSTPGKHGHSKAHLIGLDVYSGRKYEDIFPASHRVDVPLVKKTEYQLINVSGGYLSLLDDGGQVREDVRLPRGQLGTAIEQQFDRGEELAVVVLEAAYEEAVVAVKTV